MDSCISCRLIVILSFIVWVKVFIVNIYSLGFFFYLFILVDNFYVRCLFLVVLFVLVVGNGVNGWNGYWCWSLKYWFRVSVDGNEGDYNFLSCLVMCR